MLTEAVRGYRRLMLRRRGFVPDASRDIFLVTYPRSGTTWISFIAAELMFGVSPKNLIDIDALVPDVHALPPRSSVPVAHQYLIKSHLPLTGVPPYGDYRRVIYLMRDPRDVMLSYYRYSKFHHGYKGDLLAFAMDWCCGRIWPGSWQEHVNSWLGPRNGSIGLQLNVFRYEDFIGEPIESASRLARILNVSVSPARLADIVTNTSAETMRNREAHSPNSSLQFIGPATAGVWESAVHDGKLDAIKIVEEFAGSAMGRGSYPLFHKNNRAISIGA